MTAPSFPLSPGQPGYLGARSESRSPFRPEASEGGDVQDGTMLPRPRRPEAIAHRQHSLIEIGHRGCIHHDRLSHLERRWSPLLPAAIRDRSTLWIARHNDSSDQSLGRTCAQSARQRSARLSGGRVFGRSGTRHPARVLRCHCRDETPSPLSRRTSRVRRRWCRAGGGS